MTRSVDRRDHRPASPGLIGAVAAASGTAIVENPVLVGSSTAFLVILFYVSANALWYQPFQHPEPFLQTRFRVERADVPPVPEAVKVRPAARPDITNSVPPVRHAAQPGQETAAATPADDTLAKVQAALKKIGLYAGTVDGLNGPQTRRAIADYEKSLGIAETGEISPRLLDELDLARVETGAIPAATGDIPVPRPRREVIAAISPAKPVSAVAEAQVVKIQAGLRAFGNEGIELDGVMGDRTRSAIREFQSLFGLPVTGEPDGAVLTKMAEIGLTN